MATVYIAAVTGDTSPEVLTLPPSTWNGMATTRDIITGFAVYLAEGATGDDILFCPFNVQNAASFNAGGLICSAPPDPNPKSENGPRAVFTKALSTGAVITATIGYIDSYPWRITVAVAPPPPKAPAGAKDGPWYYVGIVFIIATVAFAIALGVVAYKHRHVGHAAAAAPVAKK